MNGIGAKLKFNQQLNNAKRVTFRGDFLLLRMMVGEMEESGEVSTEPALGRAGRSRGDEVGDEVGGEVTPKNLFFTTGK